MATVDNRALINAELRELALSRRKGDFICCDGGPVLAVPRERPVADRGRAPASGGSRVGRQVLSALPVMTGRWVPPRRWQYDRGMEMRSAGGRVWTHADLLALRASHGAVPVGGDDPSAATGTAALGPPAPGVGACEAERERAAALGELEAISGKCADAAAEVERLEATLADAREGRGSGVLALNMRLRALMRLHNVRRDTAALALGPPVEASSIRVKGYASTADIDLDRHRFRPGCFGTLDAAKIRLLLKHDPQIIAGTVDEISVDWLGRVLVTCSVDHPVAQRMPGFSVGVSVEKFTIHNADSAGVYGEIEACVLEEVSLTEVPGNRAALVTERWVASPLELSNEALLAKIKAFQATLVALHASGFFAVAA